MSVGSIIGGGIGLVRGQPRTVAIWTGLYCLLAMASMIVLRPFAIAMLAFQQQMAANTAAGIRTPPSFPSNAMGMLFLWELAAAVLGVIAFAAVVRAVARGGPDRFAHLRLGMDELRLIGLGFLIVIAAFVIEIIVVVVLILAGALASMVLGKPAGFAVAAFVALGLIGGAIYLEVRISLAPAFTVLQRRIVIGPAWRATKGHFWTLFGVYALLTLAFIAISLLALAFTNLHLLMAYFSLDRQALMGAAQEQLARQASSLSISMLPSMIVGAILFVVMATIAIGSIAAATIELGGADTGP